MVVTLRRGTTEEASAATHTLLTSAEPPTAVFSTTGFLTEGVLRACRQLQTSVAIVGFDDFKLADMLPTPVTVVTSDTEELGRRAARLLLDRIDGDDAPSRRTVLPVQLIARGTDEIGHP
ncbi:substrate-binding domain-containing protein [Streptomyces avermitilis]|uniref:substrate-binding domain-containing protein n=1 Tax=Streptomyces avermitilis TaxID=33903 RepID=UPI00369D37BF